MRKFIKSFLLVAVLALLINVSKVKAADALVIPSDGASIRAKTETEGQGLRFYAKLDESVKANEHGFYVVYGKTTVKDLKDAIDEAEEELILNGKKVFKKAIPGVTSENEFSVVLLEIPEVGYLDNISVIPYVIVDEELVLPEQPVTRSIGEVAIKLKEANEEPLPEGMEEALSNFFRVGYIEDNLEIVKGLIDEEVYVDLDLYEVYHESVGEVLLPVPEERLNYTFNGWYYDDEFNDEPVTEIDLSLIEESLTLYANWQEEVTEYIEDAVVRFDFGDLEGAGSAISDVEALFEHEYLTDITATTVYDGNGQGSTNYGSTSGLIKLGKSKEGGKIKFVFEENVLIDKIIVYAAGWTDTEGTLLVNNINVTGEDAKLAVLKTRYVVELEKVTNEILIDSVSGRAFLFAVRFYGPEADVPEPTLWEVSFNLGYDGAPALDSVFVEDGNKANKPTNPTRDDYGFIEWQLDGVVYDFDEPVYENIELVAYWEGYELPETHYLEKVDFVNDYPTELPSFITGTNERYADKGLKFNKDNCHIIITNLVIDGPAIVVVDLKLNGASGSGTNELLIKDAEDNLLGSELMKTGKVEVFINPELTLTEITIAISRKDNPSIYSVEILKSSELTEYTVTFNYNDGETEESEVKVLEGLNVMKPANPKREGFDFVEWQLDGEFYDFDEPVVADIELIAYWLESEEGVLKEEFSNLSISGTSYISGTFVSEHDENIEWEYGGALEDDVAGIKFGAKTDDKSYLKAELQNGISWIKITFTKPHANGQTWQVYVDDVLIGEFSNASGEGTFEKTLDIPISGTYKLEIKPKSTTSSRRQLTIAKIEWKEN